MRVVTLPSIPDRPLFLDQRVGENNTFIVIDEEGHSLVSFGIVDNAYSPQGEALMLLTAQDIEYLVVEANGMLASESIGIEEEQGELDQALEPYDPKDISLMTKTVTMDAIIRRLAQGTVLLNPDFQRREVWDEERKSRLIESLLLKIPIPMFYVSSDADDNWTVVDGLQRLSTIRDFILGKKYLETRDSRDKGKGFKLQNLEFWTEYEGAIFNQLPPKLLNRIMETEFSFTVINPPTPEDVKLNIFKRINTGGMQLSQQEIRNALYIGYSTDLLRRLAESPAFVEATQNSIHADRMQDKELILRFLSFLIRDYRTYQRTMVVDNWLSQTMIILNHYDQLDNQKFVAYAQRNRIAIDQVNRYSDSEICQGFNTAMRRAMVLFGRHAFRKSYEPYRRTPLNKSLFEAWTNILAVMAEGDFQTLIKHHKEFNHRYHDILNNSTFMNGITRDSMKWQSVQTRYDVLNSLCQEIIKKK